jgi:hypothetical protein
VTAWQVRYFDRQLPTACWPHPIKTEKNASTTAGRHDKGALVGVVVNVLVAACVKGQSAQAVDGRQQAVMSPMI